jgi:TRAP-type C4-dicarboxylate transport system substrate-binding protein
LEDLEKMVIRAVGPNGETAKALGATPVSMTVPDVYMAMERGSVEAALVPLEALITFKLNEVTKYITTGFQGGYGPYLTGMNLKVWNSLPPDIQRIMDEESPKIAFLNSRGWDKKEQEAIELMKSKGGVINLSAEEAEKWRARLMPLWDKWVADREAKKLPAKQVRDEALRLFKKYEKPSK